MRKRDGVARRHERRFIISIRVARLQSTTFFISARNSESANSIYHLGINVFKRKFARNDATAKKREKREGEKRRIARTGEPKFSGEAQAESRKKNSSAGEREKEKQRERGEYTRSRERGEERERANAEEFKIKYCKKKKSSKCLPKKNLSVP